MTQYYSDEEEPEFEISQIEREEEFDRRWDIISNLLDTMKDEISYSFNPYLLMKCDTLDLMKFLENGKPPVYDYTPRPCDNIGYIPGPINIDFINNEPLDVTSRWTTLKIKTEKELKEEEKNKQKNKQKIEKEKKKNQEEENRKKKQKENRAKQLANKHNWTMTREMRGLPKIQPKPKVVETKSKRRRQRRAGFKVKNTIEEKSKQKRKFQVSREVNKYE